VQELFQAEDMSLSTLTIGGLSAETGCNVPTIRYYEQIGLLPSAQRAPNGHRYYREADLKRLVFIKRCRDFGFPIEQVRTLLNLIEDGDRSCVEVRDMAQEHLDAVRAKLEELRQLEASLAAFVEGCDTACIGGATSDCVIIEDLSDVESKPAQVQSSSCRGSQSKNASPASLSATELKRAR
jgi:DNA-binding transcriptional MerR regulator